MPGYLSTCLPCAGEDLEFGECRRSEVDNSALEIGIRPERWFGAREGYQGVFAREKKFGLVREGMLQDQGSRHSNGECTGTWVFGVTGFKSWAWETGIGWYFSAFVIGAQEKKLTKDIPYIA